MVEYPRITFFTTIYIQGLMEQLPNHSDKPDATGEAKSSSLMLIAEGIGAYFGKLPVALQKNVTKALGHLLGVPVAYLDSVANELKATSAARVKITEATGDKLAKSIKIDNELANIALATHANKILRSQKNSFNVAKYAAEEMQSVNLQNRIEPVLSSEPEEEQVEPKEISDDWLNAFESEAVNMSSEQMQRLFGKMLAGEICRPSSFSVRTIKIMGQMDSDVAAVFRKFCSIACAFKFGKKEVLIDGRAISLGVDARTALHNYGIPTSEILILEEYGLISDTEPTYFPYDLCVLGEKKSPSLPLSYANKLYTLFPKPPKTVNDYLTFGTNGIALTRVGREIFNIVEIEENQKYTEALISYFDAKGLLMVELPGAPKVSENNIM